MCSRAAKKEGRNKERKEEKEGKERKEIFTCFHFFFFLFRAVLVAYGNSQARGQIRVAVAGLCHSHSNARFEPYLQPTPQVRAMPDP